MANTTLTAKNTFEEGLILDFSPDNTQSNCLTNALNATLLTFNGNEMALLSDMGNGRVETAYLPEGYVPVGSCEFGDIIYIVSYNPIINKSLIGCFPSPERNISSDEEGDLNLKLSWTDFLESNKLNEPTGKLKATSVKKILYGSKNMNPGDKYIIYSDYLSTSNKNEKYLSDYGSLSHLHNSFPKLVKIHVVSIEESGKIVYLDSTTKWYKDNHYYISMNSKINSEGNEDLDAHRARVNSAYSIFSSKVSGKLALLIELEKITGFSCSWLPYVVGTTSGGEIGNTIEKTTYSIYWNFNWTTDNNNINPNGAILTLSEWSGIEKGHEGLYLLWDSVTTDNKVQFELRNWLSMPDNSIPLDYNVTITRQYCPENPVTFEEFISKYEYNKYLETTLSSISKNTNTTPYKLNIYKNNGLPDVGNYLVNCTTIINKAYYTADSTGKLQQINPVPINDDLVNNYFHYPVIKNFAEFTIPTKLIRTVNNEDKELQPNISNLIYHYKIAPTMPYGILEEFEQEGFIDFSKIGTLNIELTSWKYYNYENTSTLTWGMDAYTEPGKGILEVVFEFYDNNGFAAAYHNKGKLSYNGAFTEYITLNESGSNYKLNNIKASNEVGYHKGLLVTREYVKEHPNNVYLDETGFLIDITQLDDPNYNHEIYQDDSGTLYSNYLYLVKIIIKNSVKGALDEYIDDPSSYITRYRWYWTNSMFNERYSDTKDFKDLQFTLNLDFNALYKLNESCEFESRVGYIPNEGSEETLVGVDEYTQLKANVTYINQKNSPSTADLSGNIECRLLSGLYNDYNTFNLDADNLDNISVTPYLGKSYIESPELPEVVSSEHISYTFPGIYPVNETSEVINSTDYNAKIKPNTIGPILGNLLGYEDASGLEINKTNTSYENYKNTFSLIFPEELYKGDIYSKNDYEYIGYKGDAIKLPSVKYLTSESLDNIDSKFGTQSIYFTFTGIIYSKYYDYKSIKEISAQLVRPIIYTNADLSTYNMHLYDGHFYFNNVGGICIGMGQSSNSGYKTKWRKGDAKDNGDIYKFYGIGGDGQIVDNTGRGTKDYPLYHSEVQKTNSGSLVNDFPGITPFMLIQEEDKGDPDWGNAYLIKLGRDDINAKYTQASLERIKYFTWDPYIDRGGIYDDLGNIYEDNSLMALALKDEDDVLHILNTFIPVICYDRNKITLRININNSSYGLEYKPVTLGDAVANCLLNLYYATVLLVNNIPYLSSTNLVHLIPHTYTFTKDVIFEVKESLKSGKTSNNLILIRGMRYPDYILEVLDRAGLNSDTHSENKLTSDDPNVSLTLKGIVKNCPLLFNFDYIVPILKNSTITPKYVVRCSDGTLEFPESEFVVDNLYYQDPDNPKLFNVLKQGSNFRYKGLDNFEILGITGLIIGTGKYKTIVNNPSFGEAFKFYEGKLLCSNTAYNIPDSLMFTIHGYQDTNAGLWPINKKEVLLPMGELV